jgi:dethiobiotin synthetase
VAAYFVTSTGTDIGKTFVTAALIRYLRESNQPVAALKPVVSGYDSSVVETSDPAVLLGALGRPVTADEVNLALPRTALAGSCRGTRRTPHRLRRAGEIQPRGH